METPFAGPPQRPQPDVVATQQFLARLLEAAGSGEVMRLYLESRPAEFAALVAQTRTEGGT